MSTTTSSRETRARADKVEKLVRTLEARAAATAGRTIDALGADAPLVAEEAINVDWLALAAEAKCNPPSEKSQADVLWRLKHRVDTMNDDPFAGF